MNVAHLKNKLESSETSSEHLVNAMRQVSHSARQIEQRGQGQHRKRKHTETVNVDEVRSKVAVSKRQIEDSGLGKLNSSWS